MTQQPHLGIQRLPLSRGQFVIIDAEDSDLAAIKWYASSARSGHFYAAHKNGRKGKIAYLHRVIIERMIGRPLTPGEVVDHINGDTLLNTRSNLRVATESQNMQNQKKTSANTSGYKGVYRHTKTKRWVAQIKVNRKRISLGCFDTPELAYEAYCLAAKQYHGEFANV